jgi:hypothetical protein
MTVEETEPPYPIKQLSVPPAMKLGEIALGGGVDPGAFPLYVVLCELLTLLLLL